MSFAIIVLSLGVLFLILTWWAIFHIAARDFGSTERKAIWGVVSLVPFLGVLIYIIWGRKQGKRFRADEIVE
ncbi:MAG: PLDc N-terminal domain-containing protein [Desulfatibacillum sp.]|nr:PLDc N-terminal domain-containing protein [Desulfatibacillum sp.]